MRAYEFKTRTACARSRAFIFLSTAVQYGEEPTRHRQAVSRGTHDIFRPFFSLRGGAPSPPIHQTYK
jgi:hypothetical protein